MFSPINYGKISFIFGMNDPAIQDIVERVSLVIEQKDPNKFQALEETFSQITQDNQVAHRRLSDEQFCSVIFEALFNMAFELQIDVTPILDEVLLDNDIHHHVPAVIDSILKSRRDFLTKKKEITHYLEFLPIKNSFHIVRLVAFYGKEVHYVSYALLYFIHKYPNLEYVDNALYKRIQDIIVFDGSIEQVRELIDGIDPEKFRPLILK